MQLEIAALSRTGGRSHNEDACGFWSNDTTCFCVVSDGAGGHGGGDLASKIVVHHTLAWFRERPECSAYAIDLAMRFANGKLMEEQGEANGYPNMCATVVILAIDYAQGFAVWGHLGDSRLYCFRRDRIVAQTKDHSVVQTMVDAGILSAEDARTSSQRSKLLAVMGDAGAFEPRLGELSHLQGQERFLLCSDGLWQAFEPEELQAMLVISRRPKDWLEAMEKQIVAERRERQDNYSGLAVWCDDDA